jgi:hypothetical protein
MYLNPPNAAFKKISLSVPNYIKTTFLATFVIGLLAHAYMFTNKFPNHDEIAFLAADNDFWRSGRWFLKYPSAISSVFSLPWLNGLLSLFYIAVAACLVVASLKIYGFVSCVLVAGLMVSFPVVTATFTYMFTADAYFFALLLSCLAVYLAERHRYGFLPAVIPLTLSLGCYQAYFGVSAGLMIMVLIFDCLGKQGKWHDILFKGLRFLGTLVVSLISYFIIVRVFVSVRGEALFDHMGVDQMGQIALKDVPGLIYETYMGVFTYFFLNGDPAFSYVNIHQKTVILLFILAFILGGLLLVLRCVRHKIHKEPLRLVILIILIVLLPIGFNIVFVMVSGWRHILMLYGMVLAFIFLIGLTELLPPIDKKSLVPLVMSVSSWFIVMTMAFCIYNYVVLANKAYLKMDIGYEQAYAQSVSLVTRIQSLEAYSIEKEIVLVGVPYRERENAGNPLSIFEDIQMIGVLGNEYFGDIFTYGVYLNRYLGLRQKVVLVRDEKVEDNEAARQLPEMPKYPDAGSIRIIADKIYVNFSYNSVNPVSEMPY